MLKMRSFCHQGTSNYWVKHTDIIQFVLEEIYNVSLGPVVTIFQTGSSVLSYDNNFLKYF